MLMKRFCLLLATMIAALGVVAVEHAGAVPVISPVAISHAVAMTPPPVELAHGCHRGVLRDYRGWHYHDRACIRRNTAPPGLYDYPANRRYYRGPLCSYRCGITHGVKICRQICR